MAMFQETLSFAITDLLPPISPDRIAMMVPDESARAEGQPPAALLQPPADVNVVAGLGVSRIETAHFFERAPAKGHVAAGNVLGDRVVQEHVRRPAGAPRHALRDPSVV